MARRGGDVVTPVYEAAAAVLLEDTDDQEALDALALACAQFLACYPAPTPTEATL